VEDDTDSYWLNEFKIPQEPVSAFNPFVNLPGQIQTPPGQRSRTSQLNNGTGTSTRTPAVE